MARYYSRYLAWMEWGEGRKPENRAPAYLLNVSTKRYLSTTLLPISWLLDLEVNTYDAWLACDFAFYTKGSQYFNFKKKIMLFNPLNTELNPICHLLALLGAHHIFHVSGLRVKICRKSFSFVTCL
jgi:hypothetical protein